MATLDKILNNYKKLEIYQQDYDKLFQALHLSIDIARYGAVKEIKKDLQKQYDKLYSNIKTPHIRKYMRQMQITINKSI